MATHLVIVDRRADFPWQKDNLQVVTAREYIAKPDAARGRDQRVINLSRTYEYLGTGYYVSLLGEARGERVIPTVKTILDLRQRALTRAMLAEVEEALNRKMKRLSDRPEASFNLLVFFGRTTDRRFADIAREVFDLFRCPILKVQVRLKQGWTLHAVEPLSIDELNDEQKAAFETALDAYTRASWREPAARAQARWTLAILHNPREELPPSSPRALQKFIKAGEALGIEAELIEKKDFARLAEYDALFIRETTAINNHTYRFAHRAEREDMVVIDDPVSILRCTNKIYLHDQIGRAHV